MGIPVACFGFLEKEALCGDDIRIIPGLELISAKGLFWGRSFDPEDPLRLTILVGQRI